MVPGSIDADAEIPLFLLKEDLNSLDTTQNKIVRGRPRLLKKFFDPLDYFQIN